MPPSLGGVPQTVVLVSTSGFAGDALGLAERRPGGPVILAEINDAGGWTIHAPPGYEDLASQLDPETLSQKQERVRQEIDAGADLFTGGVSAEKVSERLHLPQTLVEEVLREHAQKNPGLATGTFEGKLVLYRAGMSAPADAIGENMPFWEKSKASSVAARKAVIRRSPAWHRKKPCSASSATRRTPRSSWSRRRSRS